MNYDPAEFARLKNIIRTSDAKIAAAQDNIDAAIDAQAEWSQIAIYEKVIESDIATNVPKVIAGSTYVLRRDEAIEI